MKKLLSMLLACVICLAVVLPLTAPAHADTYCIACNTSIRSRWVQTGFHHYASCMCGAVVDGYTLHLCNQPMRACPICYPDGAPVQVKRENPEVANAGKDLTVTVKGDIYADRIYLYSAKDLGNDNYEYNRYITMTADDYIVGKDTVTLKAALLDKLESGSYAITVVTTAGSQFIVFKR